MRSNTAPVLLDVGRGLLLLFGRGLLLLLLLLLLSAVEHRGMPRWPVHLPAYLGSDRHVECRCAWGVVFTTGVEMIIGDAITRSSVASGGRLACMQ